MKMLDTHWHGRQDSSRSSKIRGQEEEIKILTERRRLIFNDFYRSGNALQKCLDVNIYERRDEGRNKTGEMHSGLAQRSR